MADPAYWLVKSEPAKYSFQDLQRDGRTMWDGVRNNQAAIWLRDMKVGDLAFYYHSQEGLAVVGIAKVSREWFPDPTDPSGRFVAVEFEPVRPLKTPVTLAEIKATKSLKDMVLVNNSRLSVQPVSAEEWGIVSRMAGLKAK